MANRSGQTHRARSCPHCHLGAGTGEGGRTHPGLRCLLESEPPSAPLRPTSIRRKAPAGLKDSVIHQSGDTGICWLIGTLLLLLMCDGQHNNLHSVPHFRVLSQAVLRLPWKRLGRSLVSPLVSLNCWEKCSLPLSSPVLLSALWCKPTST